MSRDNAKAILNSITFPQKLTSEERCRLSLLCDGISVKDSYWVKHENDKRKFADVKKVKQGCVYGKFVGGECIPAA